MQGLVSNQWLVRVPAYAKDPYLSTATVANDKNMLRHYPNDKSKVHVPPYHVLSTSQEVDVKQQKHHPKATFFL